MAEELDELPVLKKKSDGGYDAIYTSGDELPVLKKKEPTSGSVEVSKTVSTPQSGLSQGSGTKDSVPTTYQWSGGDVAMQPKVKAESFQDARMAQNINRVTETKRLSDIAITKQDEITKADKDIKLGASVVEFGTKLPEYAKLQELDATINAMGTPKTNEQIDAYNKLIAQREALLDTDVTASDEYQALVDMPQFQLGADDAMGALQQQQQMVDAVDKSFKLSQAKKPYEKAKTLRDVLNVANQESEKINKGLEKYKADAKEADEAIAKIKEINKENLDKVGFTKGFFDGIKQNTIANTIADFYISGNNEQLGLSLENLYREQATNPQEQTTSGQVGSMLGGQVKPMAVGIGSGAVNPLLGIGVGSAYYGRMGVGNGLIDAYTTARQQGKTSVEALEIAKKQATIGGVMGTAEGLAGMITFGAKPLVSIAKMPFKKAVIEALKDSGADAAFAGISTVIQNQNINRLGLKRDLSEGVIEEMGAELFLGAGINAATYGGSKIKGYGTIINGIAKLPLADIQQRIDEAVKSGVVDAARGMQTLQDIQKSAKAQEKLKGVDIPEKVENEVIDLQTKIDELEAQKKDASPAILPAIEAKIEALSSEIQIKSAIPLTAKERTELNKLQAAKDSNTDYDKVRLKELEARQKAVQKADEEAKAEEAKKVVEAQKKTDETVEVELEPTVKGGVKDAFSMAKKLSKSSNVLVGGMDTKAANYTNDEGVEVSLKDDDGGELNGEQTQADFQIDYIGNEKGERGKGLSSKELDKILLEADKNDLSVSLVVDAGGATTNPLGDRQGNIGLSNKELKNWYKRKGFIFDKDSNYGYRPKKTEDASKYKTDSYKAKENEIQVNKNLEGLSSPQDLREAYQQGRLKEGVFYEDGDNSIYTLDKGKLKLVDNVEYSYRYEKDDSGEARLVEEVKMKPEAIQTPTETVTESEVVTPIAPDGSEVAVEKAPEFIESTEKVIQEAPKVEQVAEVKPIKILEASRKYVPLDTFDAVMKYFAVGGRINTEDLKSETGFGSQKGGGRITSKGNVISETRGKEDFKKRSWVHSSKAPKMDDLVMNIAEEMTAMNPDMEYDQQQIRSEIIEVLSRYDSKLDIQAELAKKYDDASFIENYGMTRSQYEAYVEEGKYKAEQEKKWYEENGLNWEEQSEMDEYATELEESGITEEDIIREAKEYDEYLNTLSNEEKQKELDYANAKNTTNQRGESETNVENQEDARGKNEERLAEAKRNFLDAESEYNKVTKALETDLANKQGSMFDGKEQKVFDDSADLAKKAKDAKRKLDEAKEAYDKAQGLVDDKLQGQMELGKNQEKSTFKTQEETKVEQATEKVQKFKDVLDQRTDKKTDKALKAFGEQAEQAKELIDNYDTNLKKLEEKGVEVKGTKAEILADMLDGKYDEALKSDTSIPSSKTETKTEVPKGKTTETPKTKLQAAKEKLAEAKRKRDELAKKKGNLGAFKDSFGEAEEQAKADRELFDAYVDFAKEYISEVGGTIQDWAKEINEEVDENLKRAWDLANSKGGVKKTVLTTRVYEGDTREEVRKEIEKFGLNRDRIPHAEAEANAKKLIKQVGLDMAYQATINGDIVGGSAAEVYAAKIRDLNEQINSAKTTEEIEILSKDLAAVYSRFSNVATEAGQFGSQLGYIYDRDSDLGYNYEKKIKEYKDANNGEIPAEIAAKFKELDDQIKELSKQIKEAENKAQKASEQQAVDEIKASIKRNPTANKKAKAKRLMSEGLDDIAQALGVQLMASGTKRASVVTGLTKIGQSLILNGEATIENVGEKVREFVKVKFGDKLNFDDFATDFDLAMLPEESDNKLKIPNSYIRGLVEDGIDNIDDLVKAIQKDYSGTEREIRDAITGYGKTFKSGDDIAKEINRMKDIGRMISALEDIEKGQRPLKSGQQREAPTVEQREMRKKVREALKELGVDEATMEKQLKTALDAAKTRLSNQIEDMEAEIAKGEQVPKSARTMRSDKELDDLKAKRDEVKKRYDGMFKDETYKEAKRLEMTKRATERRIEVLKNKLKNEDFDKKPKKLLIEDTELTKLRAEKIRLQDEYDKEIQKAELRNRTKVEVWKDKAWEAWGITRALSATGEWSFVGVQGLTQLISNPSNSYKAAKNAWSMMWSEKKSDEFLSNLRAQEFYPIMKQSKLAITEPNSKITAREELFNSQWTNIAWGVLGSPLKLKSESAYEGWLKANPFKALERASVGYLDTIRVLRFLDGVQMLEMQGKNYNENQQAYKDMADVVNTLTGRASIGKLEGFSEELSKVFFSPRNWASGLKTTILLPRQVYKWQKDSGTKEVSVANKIALGDLSKMMGLTTSMVMLAAAGLGSDGDDETSVGSDPTSSDFGKIIIGNKRIDPWGGKIQQIVFASRMVLDSITKGGETKRLGQGIFTPTKFDLITQQATNKLAPSAGLLVNYMKSNVDRDGMRKLYGKEYSFKNELGEVMRPIYLNTVIDLLKDDPTALDGMLLFYGFFGGGIGVQEDKKKKDRPRGIVN